MLKRVNSSMIYLMYELLYMPQCNPQHNNKNPLFSSSWCLFKCLAATCRQWKYRFISMKTSYLTVLSPFMKNSYKVSQLFCHCILFKITNRIPKKVNLFSKLNMTQEIIALRSKTLF
jgi:hypothetical protein